MSTHMPTTTIALLTLAGREAWWRVRVKVGRNCLRARRLTATGREIGRWFDLASVQHHTFHSRLDHDAARDAIRAATERREDRLNRHGEEA